MGNKVNPSVFRLGVLYDWKSRWIGTKKSYSKNLAEDLKMRVFLLKKYLQNQLAFIAFNFFDERKGGLSCFNY